MIGKNVVFDDGEFEVTLIRTPKNPLALQEIIGALLSSQINTKHIYSFKTGEIHFESVEEIPWTLEWRSSVGNTTVSASRTRNRRLKS